MKALVKIVQGKVARHTTLLNDAVAVMFKIGTALAHSLYTHHVPVPGGENVLDVPLQEIETFTKTAISPSSLDYLIKDIPAHLALSPDGERVMQYE